VEVAWVARDDGLAGPLRTHYDVRIDDVGSAGSREQKSNRCCVASIEWDEVGGFVTDQA
jgi:hypothetical protein